MNSVVTTVSGWFAGGLGDILGHWLAKVAAILVILGCAALGRSIVGRRGPVARKWAATFTYDGIIHEEHITCRQFFGLVWGTSKLYWVDPQGKPGQTQKERSYKFRGRYKDDGLRAHYHAVSSPTPDFGVFMLKKKMRGDEISFSGMYLGLKPGSQDDIEIVRDYEWFRPQGPD